MFQEKINIQISQIEELNLKYQDLEQTLESSQEQNNFLQTDNANYVKKIAELNNIVDSKQVELQQERKKHEAAVSAVISLILNSLPCL